MTACTWPLLLAQARTALHGGERFRPLDTQFGWHRVGLIAAVATAIVLAVWLTTRLARARQARNSDSPWLLFRELCQVHGLSRRERHVLTKLVQQRGLDQPAAAFVDATCWTAEELGPSWTRTLPELERLRRKLFAPR